jgi:DNA replication ATP-dependent helicase Dna2
MLKRLADKHPSSVAQLALQYRMHGAICQLSNDIVYNGKLRCANKDVETRLLSLSGFPAAIRKHASVDSASCWMTKAIDPSQPVVFLDTDRIQRINTPRKPSETNPDTFTSGLERTAGKNGKGNIVNDTEATLVRQVLHALMECGLEPSNIGVICPFRSQVRMNLSYITGSVLVPSRHSHSFSRPAAPTSCSEPIY